MKIFELLFSHYGPRRWWPGDTPLEIAIGAILTQNTAWRNVEKAIENLKSLDMLDVKKLYDIETESLANIIKPSGFYNIKAKRLKNLIRLIYEEYGGDIEQLKRHGDSDLRMRLLSVKGIGEETGDSIMLYALNRPIFVVDAYTKRFLENHRLYDGKPDYQTVQKFFMENLPKDVYLFNEYHALIVSLGKDYCKRAPKCPLCPLKEDLYR
ncbi:MAG: endonuclease III domain-containing protein [Syntrophorhabdaceae bacterium]|nr:endonuclease III domain-containing protein [Syntrophorhabdaceae bacterium]